MSNLPIGWQISRLDELCEWGSGGTPRRSEPSYFGGEFPWITISDLNDGRVNDTAENLTASGIENSAAKLVPEGTVLVALYGSIGKLGITTRPSTTNQAIACALPDEQAFDHLYLFHYLRSKRHELGLQGTGVTQKNIYLGDIKAFEIPVAPRAEQTRIVTKLEELLSDLDAGVAELKAAQKKLGQYRQSLLKAAVEGALTADWREAQRKHDTPRETGAQLLQRILTERRARWEAKQLAKFAEQGKTPPKNWQKKYPEPVAPDTTHLPELPQGWVWVSMDQLAAIGTGVTPLRSKLQYYENGTVPWVTSGALNDELVIKAYEHVTLLALEECRLELYPAGALLIAMYGEGKTRGKCSELSIPATINQAIAALVLEGPALPLKPYLKFFLLKSYDDMRKQAAGGVQPNLNLQIIRSIVAPLPPLSEQQAIVETLQDQLAAVTEQAQAIELALNQSTAQRQNILRAAFAGQLVPQDPNDEPASALLARIRAERAAQAVTKKPCGRKAKELK